MRERHPKADVPVKRDSERFVLVGKAIKWRIEGFDNRVDFAAVSAETNCFQRSGAEHVEAEQHKKSNAHSR